MLSVAAVGIGAILAALFASGPAADAAVTVLNTITESPLGPAVTPILEHVTSAVSQLVG